LQKFRSLKKIYKNNIWLFFVGPAFIYLLILTIIPTISLFQYAFSSRTIADMGTSFDFIGFNNFKEVFSNPTNWITLRATLIFLVFAIFIQFILGLMSALALTESFKGISLVRTLMIAPIIATPIGVGFIWRYLLDPDCGIINWIFKIFNLPYINWLGARPWTMWSIIIADTWQWTPFIMLILLAGLSNIPKTLYEAAKVDGASTIQQFNYITIPQLKSSLILAFLLRFIWAMKTFDIVLALTRGGPGRYTSIINYEIFKQAFLMFRTNHAATLSIILLIIIIITAQFFIKTTRI